jgi:type II secretory pathway component GspD/PulD (secretin)
MARSRKEMNRSYLVRLVLAGALACAAAAAGAQQALEIISLRHRTAEQVLPVLQPLLEPGGTLSGSRNQLFLRANPGNAAEIKRVLDAIDRPSRRLEILVRHDDAQERERRELGASGSTGRRGARVDVIAEDSRRAVAERVDQRVQVLEGGRAFIFAGQSRPVHVPGATVIQEVGTGFEVVPRLSGERVLLDIQTSSAHGQRAVTTLSARLGEWVEVAGIASEREREDRGVASASSRRAVESGRVWLKVEELR